MGEQFLINVDYVSLLNPNQFLNEVNDQLDALAKEGKANIRFSHLTAVDRNTETGKWYLEGTLEHDNEPDAHELALPFLDVLLARGLWDAKKNIVQHPRYIRLLPIEELIANIKGWSTDRGILANGVWYTQATKMYEEDGEVAPGVAKNKRNLIIDGVGDMIVVMVNLLELSGFSATAISAMVDAVRREDAPAGNAHRLYHKLRISNSIAVDYLWDVAGVDSPKKLTGDMFDDEQIQCTVGYLTECLAYANALANCYEFTLEQALSMAWDEIKDRTGFLNADGIFVKEVDMTEAERKQRDMSPAEQLKDYDGDVQSGNSAATDQTTPVKTVEVSYFPIVPTSAQTDRAFEAIRATLGEGDVRFIRAGYYYGGDTFYPRPHVLFEFTLDGKDGTRHQPVEEGEHWQFAEDAVSYVVQEAVAE